METMKKNKGKEIVIRDEAVHPKEVVPIGVLPNAPRTLRLMPPSSSEKRKTVFKMIDKTNLLNCRPPTKQKIDALEPKSSKVGSFTLVKTLVVELDPSSSEVAPDVSTLDASCPTANLSTIPFVVEDLVDISRTLLRTESLA